MSEKLIEEAVERIVSNPERALKIITRVHDEVAPNKPSETKLKKVSFTELMEEAFEENIDFLCLLEREGYIVSGWSHLISGSPKCGKTELITACMPSWKPEEVLYVTEEPQSIWKIRLRKNKLTLPHVKWIFALGENRKDITAAILEGEETVVIIDTIRAFLQIKDESDNAVISEVLTPVISLCRERGKTLILVHHTRKTGGEHGEAISGGHAFLGIVDIALELKRDSHSPNRRLVRGWSRVIEIPEIMYEKDKEGFTVIGSPEDVAKDEVENRILEVLKIKEDATVEEIHSSIDEGKPSLIQVRKTLDSLLKASKVERVGEGKKGSPYRYKQVTIVDDLNEVDSFVFE